MKRTIETSNPYTNKKKTLILEGCVPLGGGTEKKFLSEAIFYSSQRRKTLPVIERGPYELWPHMSEKILNIWKACRAAGIPVVPTLRLTNQNTLISTNLKADGSEIYGKAMSMYFLESRNFNLTDSDYQFILVYPRIKIEIEQNAYKIASIAAEHGILLPIDDAFEILFRNDGNWKLIILDLSLASVDKTPPDFKRVQQLSALNQSAVRVAMETIDELYAKLSQVKNSST